MILEYSIQESQLYIPQLSALKSKAMDVVEFFDYLLALREDGIVESIDFEYMPDEDLLPERFNRLMAIYRKGTFFGLVAKKQIRQSCLVIGFMITGEPPQH